MLAPTVTVLTVRLSARLPELLAQNGEQDVGRADGGAADFAVDISSMIFWPQKLSTFTSR